MKTIQTEQQNLSRYEVAIAASADFPLDAILTELRQKLEVLYGAHLRHVVLFGSRARGDAAPESDVDVLVVLKDQADEHPQEVKDICYEVSWKYDAVVTCLQVTEDEFLNWKSPLMLNVHQDGVFI